MGRIRFGARELILLLGGILFVSPCVIAFLNSFKTLDQIRDSPWALPPLWDTSNYADLIARVGLLRPMANSALLTCAVLAGLIGVAPMAAHWIARHPGRASRVLEVLFLAGLTIPFQIIVVPLLQEFDLLHIKLTYVSLWLHHVSWGLPLCIFIYGRFVRTIPRELEEAAAIDGCGQWSTFWRSVFPLLKPCTASVIIFWGLWIWNDFVQAYIVMGPERADLAFVQLWKFISDKYVKNWNTIFAGVVLLSAPVTILYISMQRFFVKGLTAGSAK